MFNRLRREGGARGEEIRCFVSCLSTGSEFLTNWTATLAIRGILSLIIYF